jgi:hypothetical protein
MPSAFDGYLPAGWEDRKAKITSPLDALAPSNCICFPEGGGPGCVCPDGERALRHIMGGHATMTAEQREWCLSEIGRVEGYDRKDHESDGDVDLAQVVIWAWNDYCRDKGLL